MSAQGDTLSTQLPVGGTETDLSGFGHPGEGHLEGIHNTQDHCGVRMENADKPERRLVVDEPAVEADTGDALAEVRRWLRANIEELTEERRDDVALVADALAVHATENGEGLREVRLATKPGGTSIRIEVDLSSTAVADEPQSALRGLNLSVVDDLAEGYGLLRRGPVQVVWAEVAVPLKA